MFQILIDKLFHLILTIIIIGYIVFEEMIWERFAQPIIRFFTRLKILQKTSAFLKTVDSKIILAIFVSMFVVVELLGLFAASQFLQGKIIVGLFVYAGKVPVSAFTFWLFREVNSKLMEFEWFEKAYNFVLLFIERITHSQTYLDIKKRALSMKVFIREKLFRKKGFLKQKV